VSATLQADLATIPDAVNVAPRTAVGIPPSTEDAGTDKLRVAIAGVVVLRPYDSTLAQP
jgi:hypothetical protein